MKTVIMCGGAGTRLWPISTEESPKQFIKIFNNESLFEKTIQRNMAHSDEFIIVVNKVQYPICKEQTLKFKKKFNFIIEPVARNTAPAIALAAFFAKGDDTLLVVPSDHLIFDQEIYSQCIEKAQSISNKNRIVTFGINPTYPETGFGYIEAKDKKNVSEVISFKEKPDLATATKYLEQGTFFWNSGMFLFKAEHFLNELELNSIEIFSTTQNLFNKREEKENDVFFFSQDLALKIPPNSIDYAVMEKSKTVSVVPSYFRWSDLGSYDSLYEELEKDSHNNTADTNLIQYNSQNNLVISNNKKIALFDVNDLIIVDSNEAILIGKRGFSQNVKKIPK